MKRIYLVKLEDFAEPFMAFEREADAAEFAMAYCGSMPCGGEREWRTMLRECIYVEGTTAVTLDDHLDPAELDRILREEEGR